MTAHPIATQFPGYGCMDDLTTERSFEYLKLRGSLMCFAYILTCYPGVLVQLLQHINVFSVGYPSILYSIIHHSTFILEIVLCL